jgi:putative membrane protein
VLFLLSYLVYHAHAGSKPFTGQGPIRAVYFTILISHIILAALVPPLAGITLWQAFRGRFTRHRAVARWTLPMWLYVSVTGIAVYWMLYQM